MKAEAQQMYDEAMRLMDLCDFVDAAFSMMLPADVEYWTARLARGRIRLAGLMERAGMALAQTGQEGNTIKASGDYGE